MGLMTSVNISGDRATMHHPHLQLHRNKRSRLRNNPLSEKEKL
jgi:hypothetical protein